MCTRARTHTHTYTHLHTPLYRCHWPTIASDPNSPLVPLLLGNYHLGYALHMRLYPCQPYHLGYHSNAAQSNGAVRLRRDKWLVSVCVPANMWLCTRVIVLCVCVHLSVSLLVSQSSWASQFDSGYHVKMAGMQCVQAAFVVKSVTVIWHLESVCVFSMTTISTCRSFNTVCTKKLALVILIMLWNKTIQPHILIIPTDSFLIWYTVKAPAFFLFLC